MHRSGRSKRTQITPIAFSRICHTVKYLELRQIFIKSNIKDYKQKMETGDKNLDLKNLCNQLDRKKNENGDIIHFSAQSMRKYKIGISSNYQKC